MSIDTEPITTNPIHNGRIILAFNADALINPSSNDGISIPFPISILIKRRKEPLINI